MAAHVAGCFENIFDNEIVEPFSFTLELHALTLQLLAPRLLNLTRFPFLVPTGSCLRCFESFLKVLVLGELLLVLEAVLQGDLDPSWRSLGN